MDFNRQNEIYNVLIAIILAFFFSVALRFIYVSEVSSISGFYWNSHLMINNVDGYYYAEGARDIINGFHQKYDLSPVGNPLAILTAYISKFFHIPLDVLIFYMPGIFGSLIVVPLILIGRLLNNLWAGFLAALMASITWSYYHRTMFGYYDTDMLTVVLPLFSVWAIMWNLKNREEKYYFVSALSVALMILWHPGLFNLANGFFIMTLFYVLYLKTVKNSSVEKETLLLPFLIAALLPLPFWAKILIIALIEAVVLKLKEKPVFKNENKLLAGVFVIYLLSVGAPWLYNILHNSYITRDVAQSVGNLHYYDVVNTVREASKIDLDVFVHRIAGSWVGFVLGVAGYVLLLIRYPLLMISLPMFVLGFFALRGGLRFTIFAVPLVALGNAYLIVWAFRRVIEWLNLKENLKSAVFYAFTLFAVSLIIYPNVRHMFVYLVPTTFSKHEVEILNKFKKIAKRDDYVLTWWDYGYPIRYYADVKTLIDGGKHSGEVNWPVSFALTRPQLPSYNTAILDVYLTEKDYEHNEKFDFIAQVMKMYSLKSPDEVISFLYKKIKLPKIKNDIYYYLPFRMLDIFPTVEVFSYIDLKTGKLLENRPLFMPLRIIGKSPQGVVLSNSMVLTPNGRLIYRGREVEVGKLIVTYYDENKKLRKKVFNVGKGVNVILMKSYNRVVLLDDKMLDSTYVKLFILEDYDKNLFKPVISDPLVKIYKVVK